MATSILSADHPPAVDRTGGPESAAPAGSTSASRRRSRVGRVVRGRESDPVWARPALLTLLGLTAVLYLYSLSSSGYANSFYSAAVQAGSESWKAFFFGSSDAANSITVDKTPAALWIMALSVRIFGLSSWSILAPEALMGVASVGLVYLAVRRWHGPRAGLLAGAALALTPVAALMFRFNNPDASAVERVAVSAVGWAVAARPAAATARPRSPPGWPPTSPRRPSTASPSTT